MGPFYNCCLCSVSVGGGDLCEKCATLLIKAEIEKNTREIVFHQLTKAEIKKRTREIEIYQKKLKEFKKILPYHPWLSFDTICSFITEVKK